jgi:CRP-like cAMP-binding protein
MDVQETLKNSYLFRDATPQELAAVAAIAEPKKFIAGEYVCRSGEIPDALAFVVSGTVDVILKDRDTALGTIGGGQTAGVISFFDREPRLASAVTREATHMIRLPFDKLDRVLAEHPNLAIGFYRHACVFLARQIREVAPDLHRRYF